MATLLLMKKQKNLIPLSESIFQFYNNDDIEKTDYENNNIFVTQGTARNFITKSLQEIYHIAIKGVY